MQNLTSCRVLIIVGWKCKSLGNTRVFVSTRVPNSTIHPSVELIKFFICSNCVKWPCFFTYKVVEWPCFFTYKVVEWPCFLYLSQV